MAKKVAANRICDAKKMLGGLPVAPKTERVPLSLALSRVLAQNLTAKISAPPFDKSALDGYAIRRADIAGASLTSPVTLTVTQTVAAGSLPVRPVTAGTAARVMTGAMVPEGADAVVKHEVTEFTDDTVTFFAPLQGGNNIAKIGEDVLEGSLLIERGEMLCAPEIAAFAAQGCEEVDVYLRPDAAVISTGSELVAPGRPLSPGKIYNSNASLIAGFLEVYGVRVKERKTVDDDRAALCDAILSAFENCDAVITTGGVSAGDFDYMERAAQDAGAKILFHKLPFKPGGAILGAELNGKLLLGLSGNPSAAAAGLMLLGIPYLKRLCGLKDTKFMLSSAYLDRPFPKKSKNLRLLWGKKRIEGGKLIFCASDTQKNGAVSSMLGCNLLGEIPAGSGALGAGEVIKAYIL